MEWTTLAVAGMSLIGTLAGTFGGILVANKLTTYRIEQLERKVSEHNKVVELSLIHISEPTRPY